MDCEYPRWVEFLCHDISVHVPHHVNSKIPWYNLRKANESLKQNWGEYMTSCTFNWRMMKTIFTGAAVMSERLHVETGGTVACGGDSRALRAAFVCSRLSPCCTCLLCHNGLCFIQLHSSVLTMIRTCRSALLPLSCSRHPAELHVYDEKKNYVPFDQAQPEPFFEVQRKVIPNTP